MPVKTETSSLDSTARVKLIRDFPCFSTLTAKQAAELGALMVEYQYAPEEVIVTENDIIDSVYIIASGEAEVSHVTTVKKFGVKKTMQVPLASLHTGEAIGLNDTGFYSDTGKRTATVIATTEMVLLRLDLKDLYAFLKNNNLEISMYAASQQMLRMRFIKQSLPFAKLSHERLRWLADHVEEMNVPANTIIFKQAEQGDMCYLIRAGEVEITHKAPDGEIKKLAVLKPPVLFGEATLITRSPRNATATATKDTELLALKHKNLSELIESENNVANMFMTLMVDRSRPGQNPKVTIHNRTSADGEEITILKNPDNGSYFKLSNQGAFIWKQLDGKNTMQDITLALAEEMNVFAPDVVAALISKLTKEGFITNLEITDQKSLEKQPIWVKALTNIRRILEFRYAFGDADSWITRMYERYISYLFAKPAQIILALVAVIGAISFIVNASHVTSIFINDKSSLFLVFLIIPLSLIEVIFHEFGHAFFVKAFGREVHYIGVGWYWTAPVAFTDTTDMWLASRKPRMLVNLAGVYVDVLLAGIASVAIFFFTGHPYIQAVLWIFAAYTYYNAFKMLSPLQELDGYYVLMDWLEKTRLRQSAVLWLVNTFPKSIRQPSLFKQHWPEVIYWVSCIVYIAIVIILTVTVLSFIFALLNRPLNIYVSLALPLFIVVLSSLTIIADIRNQREE